MRLLLVEDDAPLAKGLVGSLRQSGYSVDWSADGVVAETALRTYDYELVILDLNLSGRDGFEVLRRLRAENKHLPVLILSAREASTDRVHGLDLGADDYLTKPFDLSELEARVRAMIRRSKGLASATVEIGRLSLNTQSRRVLHQGQVVELTRREYALLELMVLRAGHVVSKQMIAAALCARGEEMTSGAIEIHVHHVRRKIEGAGVVLRTLRGFGYLLAAAASTHETK